MSPLTPLPEPQIYVSYLQVYEPNIYLVVRSSVPSTALLSDVKTAIHSVYPDQPLFHVVTLREVLSDTVAEPRFQFLLIGAFACLALTIAGMGIYSVVSYLVSQRTSEVAIRLALGASRFSIVRTVLGGTGAWILTGLSGGLLFGYATSKIIRSLSHASAGGSAWIYGLVAILFFAICISAAAVPVSRACGIDPARVLHCE
jgi:ABC-type antimicrobial peptide transport system permease subunit